MKMILAGAWLYSMYEQASARALQRLGVDVTPFSWTELLTTRYGRLQTKYALPGPTVLSVNSRLKRLAESEKPDCILVWIGTPIFPQTLRWIKEHVGSLVISYVHDDPFSYKFVAGAPGYLKHCWRFFNRCVPEYDVHFFSKQLNVPEALREKAKDARVLMQYYVPELHRPITLTAEEDRHFGCDAVFVGHYEPDGRELYLKALLRAGLKVRLFGDKYWTREALGELASQCGEVRPVYGEEYVKALCGAKMCLCFMSRINRDSYTTRCFEIPACGRLLLSERTGELSNLFREDEEAVFFSNPEELVEKALWLKNNPDRILRISEAGMRRVHRDGHSVDDRMRKLLQVVQDYLNRR